MSRAVHIRIEGLNPVPWKAPTHTGRLTFKNAELRTYQNAVREMVEPLLAGDPWTIDIALFFGFWRRLDTYVSDSGRNVTKHRCDATNMQKALEDALQYDKKSGFPGLFRNDSQVQRVTSYIVAQGKDVEPAIEITMLPFSRGHALEPPILGVNLNADGVGAAIEYLN